MSTSESETEETVQVEPAAAEDNPVINTPAVFNPKDFIKAKFLVEMPEDFYELWKVCTKINSKQPELAFKSVGLNLVGPYDVLAGKFYNITVNDEDDYLTHYRLVIFFFLYR